MIPEFFCAGVVAALIAWPLAGRIGMLLVLVGAIAFAVADRMWDARMARKANR